MKRRLIFFLITALIAILIVILINSALKTKQATIEALQHGQLEIVVAARGLSPGNTVDASSIKLAAWPRDNLPPGAISDFNQAQGHILRQAVIENQPIVQDMLLERGKSGGVLPFLIPNGMRAMSIPVTPVSDMAGMILPHTRVDVLVTSNEGGGSNERTRIALQNVEVVAVQNTLDSNGNEPQRAEVVTLLVTPGDAERLAAAIRLGTLQLAMRSYADQQAAWTPGVNTRELLGLPAIPEQASTTISAPQQSPVIMPARYAAIRRPQVSVEVLRNGKERQTVSFQRTHPLVATPEMSVVPDPPQADPAQGDTSLK
jgi:pilus assembly protein CpaB